MIFAYSRPGVPSLGYICLSEVVYLRLAIEGKHSCIIHFQIFAVYISVNTIFKNRFHMLFVKYINVDA